MNTRDNAPIAIPTVPIIFKHILHPTF
jgi:hypothetical protein